MTGFHQVSGPNIYTLGELSRLLDVELRGNPSLEVNGLATLKGAGAGQLSFLSNPRYAHQLATTKATAVILDAAFAAQCPSAQLISSAPYVTYAKASQLFECDATSDEGIHATAIIDPTAIIEADVSIGPYCVLGKNVRIGKGTRIAANVTVGDDTRIGTDCHLYANVSLYHRVHLGDRVVLHSAVVIGADGFGFAFDGRRSIKIAQLGGVRIGDDVEIGAGSTVDRGALDDTIIEQGVKIDNHVQIAHNCIIGEHTIICGCSAIAGSTSIGRYCTIGGGVGIIGHLHIADKVMISAMSLVSQSIPEAGIYSSGTGLLESKEWKRNIVRFRQLDDMAKRLRELEKITTGK